MKEQYYRHTETSQQLCNTKQAIGFYKTFLTLFTIKLLPKVVKSQINIIIYKL